jgi:xanthine phosphoribosyltransferase
VQCPAVVGDGGGWLVVDDLVDTGRTAKVLRKLMPKAHFAAIYVKPLSGRWSILTSPR